MNKDIPTLQIKEKCSESCQCSDLKDKKIDEKLGEKPQQAIKNEKLDPTHFGDWQVNCRAIDF